MFLLNDSTHRMLMRYDSLVGHLHVPNLVARVPHKSGGYLLRTNSLGFRSDLEFKNAPGERLRILVFGDSFTAGEGCDNHERYAELLGQDLDAEVYNYGLSGSAPDQHLILYREIGKRVDADLIIWGISIHTIERVKLQHRPSIDRLTGKPILVPKPYFTLDNGQLVPHHVPVPRLRPGLDTPNDSGDREDSHIETASLNRIYESRMMVMLRKFAKRFLPGFKDHLRGLVYRILDVQLYDDYLDKRSSGWALLSALINEFKMEAQDIPVLVVPLPTYHYYVDRLRPAYQHLYDSLEDSDRGLFVCDILDDLHKGKNLAKRKALCFEGDGHYSPYGHQEISRLIAAEIRRRRLLPKSFNSADRASAGNSRKTESDRYILGLAFGAEDSAAALVCNGEIIAAAQECSFTQVAKQGGFPHLAANYCLEEAHIGTGDLTAVSFGGAPSLEMRRDALALRSNSDELTWRKIMAHWVLHDLDTYPAIRKNLQFEGLLLESAYSLAQCAAAFYPSPYSSAAIISFHGNAQRANTCIAMGDKVHMKLLKESSAPHNLQLFYLAMVRVISGRAINADASFWNLAQTGEPEFARKILDELVDLKKDGSIELNAGYFSDATKFNATDEALEKFFGIQRRKGKETPRLIENIARSAQVIVCDAIVRMARHARDLTGQSKLCVSGQIAHDPEVRRALLKDGSLDDFWIQPLTGSTAAALGSALTASFAYCDIDRVATLTRTSEAAFGLLGPAFSTDEIAAFVDTYDYPFEILDSTERANRLAAILGQGKVVGHFSGRLSADPEIVGDRLIMMGSRSSNADSGCVSKKAGDALGLTPTISVPETDASADSDSPWRQFESPDGALIWAHAVSRDASPGVYEIIQEFEAQTGSRTVLTAPLKLPRQAPVCTPLDAYRCFMQSDMDVIVLGNRLLSKTEQPPWPDGDMAVASWQNQKNRMAEKRLLERLGPLYKMKFKTAARKIRSADQTQYFSQFGESRTCWNEIGKKGDQSLVSEVSVSLEELNLSPRRLALAVVDKWEMEVLQDQFQKILVELARLRNRLANGSYH